MTQKSQAAMRAVLEGLPDATVGARKDGRIVFVNALAEELFGYDRDELLGQPVADAVARARARALHAQHGALLRSRAPAALHDARLRAAPRRHRVRRRDELGDRRDRGRAAAAGDRARHHRAPRGERAAAPPVAQQARGRRAGRARAARRRRRATSPARRSSACARRCRRARVERLDGAGRDRRLGRGERSAGRAGVPMPHAATRVHGGSSRSAPATRSSARSRADGTSATRSRLFLRGVANVLATGYGAAAQRGADAPPGAARPADRAGQPRAVPRPARARARARRARRASAAACCSSTSTTSSASTTSTATRRATRC